MSEIDKIFTCKRCGFCCHGETTVSLDISDRERMVAALEQNEERVRETYWKVSGPVVQMKTVDGHCIFYDDGCLVHSGRPWRCAQWPLVPAILSERDNYTTISESCPGIKKDVGYEEFCRILSSYLDACGTKICSTG